MAFTFYLGIAFALFNSHGVAAAQGEKVCYSVKSLFSKENVILLI